MVKAYQVGLESLGLDSGGKEALSSSCNAVLLAAGHCPTTI